MTNPSKYWLCSGVLVSWCAFLLLYAMKYSAIGFAVLVTGLFVILAAYIRRQIQYRHEVTKKVIQTSINQGVVANQSTVILSQRFPNVTIPVSTYSMLPTNLLGLIACLDELRPRKIVELGSGISTVFMAHWLREHGSGCLLSYDHEESWANLCNAAIDRAGLSDFAMVHLAKLKSYGDADLTDEWYDLDAYEESLHEIDLLVVDGPPAGRFTEARLPAYDYFEERLCQSRPVIVFIDDGLRPGERALAERWEQSTRGGKAMFCSSMSGFWIIRLNSATVQERQSTVNNA